MKVYATIGTSQQTVIADGVQYTPSAEEVLMQSERPSEGDYIADESGAWVVDNSAALAALDAEYAKEKGRLCESYTTAQMQGDTETAEAVAEDLAALDAWYDEEYTNIEQEAV